MAHFIIFFGTELISTCTIFVFLTKKLIHCKKILVLYTNESILEHVGTPTLLQYLHIYFGVRGRAHQWFHLENVLSFVLSFFCLKNV
jgi:hypothetical protein